MRRVRQSLFLIGMLFWLIGCSREKHPDFTLFKRAINKEKLTTIEGRYYRRSKPYSGAIFTAYSNGSLEMEAILNHGLPDGIVIHWYESGQKRKEAYYAHGRLEGIMTDWYENGQKERTVTYENNKMNGLSLSWYENGQRKSEVYYRNNRIESVVRYEKR